jgi:hypothetical protein
MAEERPLQAPLQVLPVRVQGLRRRVLVPEPG